MFALALLAPVLIACLPETPAVGGRSVAQVSNITAAAATMNNSEADLSFSWVNADSADSTHSTHSTTVGRPHNGSSPKLPASGQKHAAAASRNRPNGSGNNRNSATAPTTRSRTTGIGSGHHSGARGGRSTSSTSSTSGRRYR